MENKTPLETVQNDFKAVVQTIDKELGDKYSTKNPGLVQHLLDKIQEEKQRAIQFSK